MASKKERLDILLVEKGICESREKAKYFGQQFIELWFDYLMFNVKKVQE